MSDVREVAIQATLEALLEAEKQAEAWDRVSIELGLI